ncbi:Anthranilate synthase, amidotransferase component @ Para-aminobenzoate synthase, amidotransferase component |uniref:Anthranilate synthase, amidotransferase component @ Para-aminobenzoate synthase, amidotransferase component \
MILIIDNYDSFTYNLVQVLGSMTETLKVIRNDKITVSDIHRLNPDYIVLSPGPCTPNEAGVSMGIAKELAKHYPILGVCLGHQSIAQAYGAQITSYQSPLHGKTSSITHDGEGVFAGIPSSFHAARYHSLIIEPSSLPDCFEVSAESDGVVMGIRHKEYKNMEGIQFHPESFMTEYGQQILANFVDYNELKVSQATYV